MEGYIKKKNKLIPEFLNFVKGNFPGINWQGQKIPEFIWIAFIIKNCGFKSAIGFLSKYVKLFNEIVSNYKLNPFLLSSIEQLKDEEIGEFQMKIQDLKIDDNILKAISLLLSYFPECPLNKIIITSGTSNLDILELKEIISELTNRKSKLTVFTFGSVIYISIYVGMINVPKEMSLSNFTPLNDYPTTEASQKLASSIRASINIYFNGQTYNFSNKWIKYFWNQSYSFEPLLI